MCCFNSQRADLVQNNEITRRSTRVLEFYFELLKVISILPVLGKTNISTMRAFGSEQSAGKLWATDSSLNIKCDSKQQEFK